MKRILYIVLSVLIVVIGWLFFRYFFHQGNIYLAVVVPSIEDSQAGNSFLNGIELYIREVNRRGGVNGKKIRLDIYEDENNADKAWSAANRIVTDKRALAVIGHYYSSCSIRAGDVYRDFKIPAVTPASTNVQVTLNNDWYFRSTFNDDLQGKFLANYAATVFDAQHVSIIHENMEYGKYIASVFEQTSKELGVTVKYKWGFNLGHKTDTELYEIVNDLALKQADAGLILLATHAPEGVKLLQLIHQKGIRNLLMAPDAYSSESFQKNIRRIENLANHPGYLTDGMYVITPWSSDTTSQIGQRFKDDFRKANDELPDWHAAFAFDSVMVLVQALRNAGISGTPDKLIEDRIKIRDYLAGMNNIHTAVNGVSGYNYFDQNGDSQKPIYIGVYRNQQLISALTQFRTIPDIEDIPNLEEMINSGKVISVGGKYAYQINLVYTGIEIKEISDIDSASFNCSLDFYIWFRYGKDIEIDRIEFLNAEQPIILEQPLVEKLKGQLKYSLYRVKGRFRANFLPEFFTFGQHVLGFNFRHTDRDNNNLVFISDVLGMYLQEGDVVLDKAKRNQIMATVPGWRIKQVNMFRDESLKSALGDPDYFHIKEGLLEFSRFNLAVQIVEDDMMLRYTIKHKTWSLVLMIFSLLTGIALELFVRGRFLKPYAKPLWLAQVFIVVLLLISAECYIIETMSFHENPKTLQSVVQVFDVLWWIIAAYLLTLMIERFIWSPIEKRTGRSIPHIIKGLLSFLIYLLSIFAIIAFVYNQALTSLLATSGVIAMIIGLAIQINISNIFSGIAINLERPFRIGDWVKIGAFNEGKVVDINWRTTRIHTRDDTILSIPNSQASETVIENFSYPNIGYWKYTTIHVDPHHQPEKVKRILLNAALSCEGVQTDPPPSTRFLGLTAGITGQSSSWAANYLVSVYFNDYGKKFAHNETVWTNVWAHLKLAGVQHVMERKEIQMSFQGMVPKRKKTSRRLGILQDIEIFQPFSDEDKEYLAEKMRKHIMPQGQMIVQQGAAGDSLFIIVEGVLGVWVRTDRKKTMEVAKLGAGTFFGEMALLTGEPRSATIVAITESCLYEITKSDIDPLLQQRPELFAPLSEVLSRRKMETEYQTSLREDIKIDEHNLATQILGKIQNFFGLR